LQDRETSGVEGAAQSGPLRTPFVIVPDLPAGTEDEPEKERVDAEAASAEVAALLTSPAGVTVLVDTGAKWDGVESIASLEAHNGVTKSRGVIFAPVQACSPVRVLTSAAAASGQHDHLMRCCVLQARRSRLHSFSFLLKLKRGTALGFAPIVAVWWESCTQVHALL